MGEIVVGKVIGFLNQKGGCGKSTTSVHFAHWLVLKRNETVCLVDADGQGSSSRWISLLDVPIPCEVVQSADDLLDQIPVLAERYSYLVVDGPANLSDATRAILLSVHLAVLPCQPSGLDLQSVFESARLVKQARLVRQGPPQAAVFLSRAIKGTRLKQETITALKQLPDTQVLRTVVHQRQAIADAFGQSVTVWEMSGGSAPDAAREYDQLFREVLELAK
jgi:chromosome partitioning protein